ncbi:MAG: hypothetical protein ACOVLC_14435 [Flavobacterium sp.]
MVFKNGTNDDYAYVNFINMTSSQDKSIMSIDCKQLNLLTPAANCKEVIKTLQIERFFVGYLSGYSLGSCEV